MFDRWLLFSTMPFPTSREDQLDWSYFLPLLHLHCSGVLEGHNYIYVYVLDLITSSGRLGNQTTNTRIEAIGMFLSKYTISSKPTETCLLTSLKDYYNSWSVYVYMYFALISFDLNFYFHARNIYWLFGLEFSNM